MSAKELDYQDISHTLTGIYTNYCESLERTLNEYCKKSKDVAKIVKLVFNDEYEEGTKEYYMARCMRKILFTIYDNDPIYSIRYKITNNNIHLINPIENIIFFINKFLNVTIEENSLFINFSEYNEGVLWAVKLDLDETTGQIYINTQGFLSEYYMKKSGYTNIASNYIKFLKKYAEYKMKNKDKE